MEVPGERRTPAHKGRLIINYTASRMHSRDFFFALASPAPGCSGESECPITRKVNLLKSSSYGHHIESTSTSDHQGESIVTSLGIPRRDLNHTPRGHTLARARSGRDSGRPGRSVCLVNVSFNGDVRPGRRSENSLHRAVLC